MKPEVIFHSFVADPVRLDLSPVVYRMWLNGMSAREAYREMKKDVFAQYNIIDANNNPNNSNNFNVIDPIQIKRLSQCIKRDVMDQYRTLVILEHFLTKPLNLPSISSLQLSAHQQRALIDRFYSFDSAFMRELLGKKLAPKIKKDLSGISHLTKIPLGSCNRQFNNLLRIFRCRERALEHDHEDHDSAAEVENMNYHSHLEKEGPSAVSPAVNTDINVDTAFHTQTPEKIRILYQRNFLLSKELAQRYARVVFLCRYRFDTDGKLMVCSYEDFDLFARVLGKTWGSRSLFPVGGLVGIGGGGGGGGALGTAVVSSGGATNASSAGLGSAGNSSGGANSTRSGGGNSSGRFPRYVNTTSATTSSSTTTSSSSTTSIATTTTTTITTTSTTTVSSAASSPASGPENVDSNSKEDASEKDKDKDKEREREREREKDQVTTQSGHPVNNKYHATMHSMMLMELSIGSGVISGGGAKGKLGGELKSGEEGCPWVGDSLDLDFLDKLVELKHLHQDGDALEEYASVVSQECVKGMKEIGKQSKVSKKQAHSVIKKLLKVALSLPKRLRTLFADLEQDVVRPVVRPLEAVDFDLMMDSIAVCVWRVPRLGNRQLTLRLLERFLDPIKDITKVMFRRLAPPKDVKHSSSHNLDSRNTSKDLDGKDREKGSKSDPKKPSISEHKHKDSKGVIAIQQKDTSTGVSHRSTASFDQKPGSGMSHRTSTSIDQRPGKDDSNPSSAVKNKGLLPRSTVSAQKELHSKSPSPNSPSSPLEKRGINSRSAKKKA